MTGRDGDSGGDQGDGDDPFEGLTLDEDFVRSAGVREELGQGGCFPEI